MPVNIWLHEYTKVKSIQDLYSYTCYSGKTHVSQKEYTLVHNNPDYHVISKGDNVIYQGSMMYNPNSHKIVDTDEYHVIKKSDVDGDVMEALKFIRDYCHNHNDYWNNDLTDKIKISIETIRNALIAQSAVTYPCQSAYNREKAFAALQELYETADNSPDKTGNEGRLYKDVLRFGIDGVRLAQSDPDIVRIPRKVLEGVKLDFGTGKFIPAHESKAGYQSHKMIDAASYNQAINDVLNYKEGE